MITLILHHSALELINEGNCNITHNAVKNDAIRRNRKQNEILLDISVHQSAIHPDKMINCGRPDLIHICLLQYHHAIKILSRLTNKIDFFIHTRDDKVFLVPQSWRVPVHFIRFRGLMEKFLVEGNLKLQDNERIFLKKKNLNELVNSLEPNLLVNLTETGLKDFNTFETLNTYLENDQKMVLLIGGFQKGDYDLQKILKRDITNVSLTGESTTAWMIISILMTGLLLNK